MTSSITKRLKQITGALALMLSAPYAFAAAPSNLDLATTLGSLVLVIGVILLLAWLLKRMQVPALGQQKGLRIVSQLPVGTKERIAVVQVGEEQFLVGITSQSIQILAKLEKPLKEEELATNAFASQFSQLIKKNDKGNPIRLLFSTLVLLVGVLFSLFSFAEAEESPLPANLAEGSSVTVQAMQSDTGSSRSMSVGNGAGIPAFTMTTNPDGSEDYSVTLQILALMTMLGFLPAMVILMTSFTRIVVVMSILRQAMGLQQTPSNQVIIGIALFLTFFVMSPVLNEINDTAIQPYLNEQVTAREAFDAAQVPMKAFMLKQTRIKDLETFVNMSGEQVTNPEDVSMAVLIPAFITSELKTAFQIGFMLFLPFLIIDLVVASVLMAMGMMMLSPMIVSLPFKLMLFVLVDGWNLILSTLAGSFAL
ncbi:flagellar type III secretion system pore protein FliP [Vibrio parahaemolyticus]|nr:flagellar type III secretion system pore protein FliP [Vibrio parahaemolyticus]